MRDAEDLLVDRWLGWLVGRMTSWTELVVFQVAVCVVKGVYGPPAGSAGSIPCCQMFAHIFLCSPVQFIFPKMLLLLSSISLLFFVCEIQSGPLKYARNWPIIGIIGRREPVYLFFCWRLLNHAPSFLNNYKFRSLQGASKCFTCAHSSSFVSRREKLRPLNHFSSTTVRTLNHLRYKNSKFFLPQKISFQIF